MFVSSGKEKDVKTLHSFVARYRVTTNSRVAMTKMPFTAGIVDRCGNVIFFVFHKKPPSPIVANEQRRQIYCITSNTNVYLSYYRQFAGKKQVKFDI